MNRADTHSTPDHGTGRALLCAVTVFFWFAQYVYVPFLTPYLFTLSITATTVGIIVGAYGITQLIFRIPLGITVDIVQNHKLFIIIGTVLAGASSIGMMISPSPAFLCIANALSGAASSTWISFTVLYPSYYGKSEATKAISTINMFSKAGTLAAFIAGGFLFARVGIRGLFVASFVSGMIGALLALFIKPEGEVARVNISMQSFGQVMREKSLLFSSVMSALMFLVTFGTVYSFTTSTAKNLGATGGQLALCVALFSASGIAGSYFSGTRSARKVGEKTVLLVSFLMLAAYCAGVGFSHRVVDLFPLQVVAGLANGVLTATLMAYAIRHIDPARKSTAMGFYQSVYCLGITLGPVLMGYLVDHTSVLRSFTIMALIALACAFAIPPFYERKTQT